MRNKVKINVPWYNRRAKYEMGGQDITDSWEAGR